MNFDDIEIRIKKPYPEIVDATDDKITVAILKNLATSRVGELEAILQYIYQSAIAERSHDDIAEIFDEVAVVEMTHLHLLMEAIIKFGGLPIYEDAQGNMFNTSRINYSVKLKDMLDNNIAMERMAIRDYREAEIKVKNHSLKKLFERIIEDEERHLEIFEKIKRNVEFLSI